eukprot:4414417-Heterocapsa_arctica.AAC.1
MYHRWNSSSSCVMHVGQRRGVPATASASLTCGQVPPASMFLKAPASLGAVASSFLSICLGMVQSTTPCKPSRSLRCITAFFHTLAVAFAMAICSMSFG